MTVEDPVEYELDGISQTSQPEGGHDLCPESARYFTSGSGRGACGEIRDGETAQIAVQASLTGHLVLSTLHTNSAAGALSRLQDMGIPPFCFPPHYWLFWPSDWFARCVRAVVSPVRSVLS